jgi:hypothetical protein
MPVGVVLQRMATEVVNRSQLQVVLTATAIAIVYMACERIPYNGGLGFDGTTYAAIAKAGPIDSIKSRLIDSYYVQRMLPSVLVHGALEACRAQLTERNIIRGFVALNIILMAINVWVWQRIASELTLSRRGRLLGLVVLFGNLFVLKMTAYYPVLTDMAAYTVSLTMLYGYLRNSAMMLGLATLLGCFTWPPCVYLGGLLLLFPRRADSGDNIDSRPWNYVAACGFSAAVVAVLCYVLTKPDGRRTDYAIDWSVVYVSIAVAGAYIFAAISTFLRHSPVLNLRRAVEQVLSVRTIALLAFLAAVRIGQQSIAPKAGARMIQVICESLAPSSIREPGIFLVAHVVYFGPVVLLIVLLWGRICRTVAAYGLGLSLCILLGVAQGLESESRHVICTVAFLAPFAVKVLDETGWRARHFGVLAMMSLVCSKVWLTINTAPVRPDGPQWPDQRFLMNFGHAMSRPMYLIQAIVALVAACVLAAVLKDVNKRSRRSADAASKPAGEAGGQEVPSVAA